MQRVCFVIETMEVVDGQKLKSAHPDKYGYYTAPLAVIGHTTMNKTYYMPGPFVEAMTGPSSPFAMQVRNGNMFGEWGHPFTKDLERIGIVMEDRYAHHLRKVYTRELPDGSVMIMGEMKPFGPYGKYLEESFASPYINTAFSLRSLCTEVFNRMENRIDRTVKYFVTFDAVGSSGYKESTKRYTNLGTGKESLNYTEKELVDKTNFSMDVAPEDFFTKEGRVLPAFESKNIITDGWLTDLFGAKEIKFSTTSVPVNGKYINGKNNIINEDGHRTSLIHSLWSN